MPKSSPTPLLSPWELAAETIAVKVRWFGLIIGYILVNAGPHAGQNQFILNGLLSLGLLYAILDTVYSLRGEIFLGRYPLLISLLEAFFIAILCFYDQGLDSVFRYYYFLSLICCSVRYSSAVTYITFAVHCASYLALFTALPHHERDWLTLLLMVVILGWVTWASNALAILLKRVGNHLKNLNTALQENQTQLEVRIAERSSELQEARAILLHQEKMASFGLLAAGIAHEVGNPLTAVSSLVQILQRRGLDTYTHEKLELISGQLRRIQATLRELINFSRPVEEAWALVSIPDVIEEALSIAKYYKRTKDRVFLKQLPENLPLMMSKRNALVQAVLNLILNAVDATKKNGHIRLCAELLEESIVLQVQDDGCGIDPDRQAHIFQPYFTTKKEGTGLGLFVTKKLVSDLGGTIDFHSTADQGTTFSLILPLAPAALEPAADLVPASSTPVLPLRQQAHLPAAGGI
jgi:two-component system NtrC family sensor kinase